VWLDNRGKSANLKDAVLAGQTKQRPRSTRAELGR
jgi:hypothetical protein